VGGGRGRIHQKIEPREGEGRTEGKNKSKKIGLSEIPQRRARGVEQKEAIEKNKKKPGACDEEKGVGHSPSLGRSEWKAGGFGHVKNKREEKGKDTSSQGFVQWVQLCQGGGWEKLKSLDQTREEERDKRDLKGTSRPGNPLSRSGGELGKEEGGESEKERKKRIPGDECQLKVQ